MLLLALSEGFPLGLKAGPGAGLPQERKSAKERGADGSARESGNESHLKESSFGRPLLLSPGELHVYEVRLDVDDFLHLRLEQLGRDVSVTVLDPDGDKVLWMDSLNGERGPEDVPLLATRSGVHRIRIEAANQSSKGFYRASVLARRKALPEDRLYWRAARSYWQGQNVGLSWAERAGLLSEAALLWRQLGWKQGEADALIREGYLLNKNRKWQVAKESLEQAVLLVASLRQPTEELAALNELGLAQEALLDLHGARRSYQAALALARKDRVEQRTATILVNLGLAWLGEGEFARADRAFDEAKEICNRSGTAVGKAAVLNALGRSRCEQGDCLQALTLHRQALELLDPKRDAGEIATTYLHLGDAFDGVGDSGHAKSYYSLAQRTWHSLSNHAQEAVALINLAAAYVHDRNLHRALEMEERSLGLYQALGDDSNTVIALLNVGWLRTELNQTAQAQAAYDAAETLLAHDPREPLHLAFLGGLARLERRRGDLEAALHHTEQALAIVESLRGRIGRSWLRMTFLAGAQGLYSLEIELLMQRHEAQPGQGWDRLAFEASERSRARALLESLVPGGGRSAVTIETVQRDLLDADSAFLEYSLGDDRSFLWLVTQRSCTVFRLPGRSKLTPLLNDVVARLQRSLRAEELPETYHRSKQLSRALLGPLRRMPRERRLVVAAPAEMQSLPFVALPDPFSRSEPTQEHPWPHPLLESKEIVAEPSAGALAAIRAHRRQQKESGAPSIALLAVPEVIPTGWLPPQPPMASDEAEDSSPPLGLFAPLRFWREEADAVTREARGLPVTLLGGVEAQVESVEQGQLQPFQILHFVTHGYFDEEHPERSALVLSAVDSSGRARDPFLTAHIVERLHLGADLVFLDGCRTGRGRLLSGEGAVGLSHAFLVAGASRLIVSLFDVYDPDAPDFVAAFYHGLLGEKRSVGDALRQAQLATWRQPGRAAPANWAGFVHIGEWRQ